MKKLATVAAFATIAAVGFAPAAFAKHKHHAHAAAVAPVASPVVDAQGQFYASPVSAGPADLGELRVVPGVDIATGVAAGALAIPGTILPVVTP